jgi:hypothetical protein
VLVDKETVDGEGVVERERGGLDREDLDREANIFEGEKEKDFLVLLWGGEIEEGGEREEVEKVGVDREGVEREEEVDREGGRDIERVDWGVVDREEIDEADVDREAVDGEGGG